MSKKKLTNIQKVLLFAYRSNKGITWAMTSMIKTVSPLDAYATVMRIKRLGLLTKSSYYKIGKITSFTSSLYVWFL